MKNELAIDKFLGIKFLSGEKFLSFLLTDSSILDLNFDKLIKNGNSININKDSKPESNHGLKILYDYLKLITKDINFDFIMKNLDNVIDYRLDSVSGNLKFKINSRESNLNYELSMSEDYVIKVNLKLARINILPIENILIDECKYQLIYKLIEL
jgi:hypothetical protein